MTLPVANFVNTVATGGTSTSVFITVFAERDPTIHDTSYPVQKRWINLANGQEWILISFSSTGGVITANWLQLFTNSIPTGAVWVDQATSTDMVVGFYYFATAAITLTLPTTAVQGDEFQVVASSSGAVLIQSATGQYIALGDITSAEAGGTTSSANGDAITLVFQASSSTWWSMGVQGDWNTV